MLRVDDVSANWIVLSVCATCYIHVSGCGEVHDESDQLSVDALERDWAGYHMWNDCHGDGCEAEHRHFDGEHVGGFTWSACRICGQTGRDDYRVIAEAVSPAALQDMAAETYVWGWEWVGWKAIPGARTYTQAGWQPTPMAGTRKWLCYRVSVA